MGTKSSAWWEHKKVWSFCTFCPDYQHFLTFPVRYSGYGLNTIIKNLDKLSGIQAIRTRIKISSLTTCVKADYGCSNSNIIRVELQTAIQPNIPTPIKANFQVIFD